MISFGLHIIGRLDREETAEINMHTNKQKPVQVWLDICKDLA